MWKKNSKISNKTIEKLMAGGEIVVSPQQADEIHQLIPNKNVKFIVTPVGNWQAKIKIL